MTHVLIDPAAGELSLSRAALLALAARDPVDGSRRTAADELQAKGLLGRNGRAAPEVALLADIIAEPTITGTVLIAQPGGVVGADWWARPDGFVLHGPGDACNPVIVLPLSRLPRVIARLVDISPRPHLAPRQLPMPLAAVIDACIGVGAAPWPSDLPADEATPPRCWTFTWQPHGGQEEVTTVLDLGPGGLWRPVSREDGDAVFEPTRPADALARLCRPLMAE